MKRTLLLAASAAVLAAPTIAQELPPGNPLPGECFARVIVPATYEISTEQVVLRQAGESLQTEPSLTLVDAQSAMSMQAETLLALTAPFLLQML